MPARVCVENWKENSNKRVEPRVSVAATCFSFSRISQHLLRRGDFHFQFEILNKGKSDSGKWGGISTSYMAFVASLGASTGRQWKFSEKLLNLQVCFGLLRGLLAPEILLGK